MNCYSRSIAAPAAVVWHKLVDVNRWPAWTASTSMVEKLDDGALSTGHRVRIRQPKMSTMVWTVSALDVERRFEWYSNTAGVTTEARHEIEGLPDGGVRVTLTVRHRGLLAPLVRLVSKRRTQRYIQIEAKGLEKVSESIEAGPVDERGRPEGSRREPRRR